MPIASLLSAGLLGIDAYPIHVEVDITRGLPGWSTVGLPESAVKEAKERVISAIMNCGYDFPFRRITLNLAPADIRKHGTSLDLPIAIGLLSAAEVLPNRQMRDYFFLGELSLDGRLRPARGVLSVAVLARSMGLKGVIVPHENVWEARQVESIQVLGARDLPQVVEFLLGQDFPPLGDPPKPSQAMAQYPDFQEVKGQTYAKRALEIAAAGFHNVLLSGPPGTGKSMLSARLSSILPPMSFEESLTSTKIYSLMGLLKPGVSLLTQRPFRAPHHTISDAGLIGGGRIPRPGEVSLAHNGVLFLDELTEFKKHVLESLRQPLETQSVTVSRALQSLTYPSRFLLVAAMNPCPCGNRGHPTLACTCTSMLRDRYRSKISGPLLDRIDLQIEVPPLTYEELQKSSPGEPSERIRERVENAWQRQRERLADPFRITNSQMNPEEIRHFCPLNSQAEVLLEKTMQRWGLSARAFHRILKVARTIADLEASDSIETPHLAEAIGYRLELGKGGL